MSGLLHSYKTRDYAGVIVMDGPKKRVELKAPRYYQHDLNKFRVGEEISLYVTSKKPLRTIRQNRYYRVYLNEISLEGGHDVDYLHEFFKGEFLSSEPRLMYGKEVRKKGSTTELSVNDFCEYILKIAELTGIEPPPTESYNLGSLRPQLHEQ